MQQHLFNHFCTSGHCGFLEDVSLTFIDKINPSDPFKREDYWRSTLKTMAPFGLNIEESVRKCEIANMLSIYFYRTGTFWGFLDIPCRFYCFFLFVVTILVIICCYFCYCFYHLLLFLSLLFYHCYCFYYWCYYFYYYLFMFLFFSSSHFCLYCYFSFH